MPHEFDGEAYKKSSIHQKEWGNKIISEFHFRGNERILDLGCGDGALTANLATLVSDGFVLGIDSSHSMIETAKKWLRKRYKLTEHVLRHFDGSTCTAENNNLISTAKVKTFIPG